jgi:hypothetical protein
MVRATIDNPGEALKPEMFANVTIYSAGDRPAGRRAQAGADLKAIRCGSGSCGNKSIELRQIKIGMTNGDLVRRRAICLRANKSSRVAACSSIALRPAANFSVSFPDVIYSR